MEKKEQNKRPQAGWEKIAKISMGALCIVVPVIMYIGIINDVKDGTLKSYPLGSEILALAVIIFGLFMLTNGLQDYVDES